MIYERLSLRTIKVKNDDGSFAGFLDLNSHRSVTGLNRIRSTWWEGRINGVEIRQNSLPKAKKIIEARA